MAHITKMGICKRQEIGCRHGFRDRKGLGRAKMKIPRSPGPRGKIIVYSWL
jgi:lactam utilization protein B